MILTGEFLACKIGTMKKLVVDKDKCIGCGTCLALAAKSFKMAGDKAEAINPPGDPESTVNDAIASCPTAALSWKKIVYKYGR